MTGGLAMSDVPANAGGRVHELAARRQVAEGMADAARSWLERLDPEQRAIGTGAGPADDSTDAERRRWFYTPTDHGGLTVHQQRPAQQRAAMRLVASGLSTPAYVTVATIMGLENVLDHSEDFTVMFDRERGRDPGMYFLRVFGEPGGPRPWGWRFGGHHVSLNNLVVDGVLVSSTPLFLGADPARSPLLGGGVNRPLARVEDLARELVRSMHPDLRHRAVLLAKAPSDLVTANRTSIDEGDRVIPLSGIWRGPFTDPVQQARLLSTSDRIDDTAGLTRADHDVIAYTAAAKGVAATDLDADQRTLLRGLLSTYLDRVPDTVSPAAGYAEDAVLDPVHIAWAGSTELGEPHYYRVQGPDLLIEWDNTQRGANHAHSVWRNPRSDFGLDVLARHRAAHRH